MRKKIITESNKEYDNQRLKYLLKYKGSKDGSFFMKNEEITTDSLDKDLMESTKLVIDEEITKLLNNL